jgi:Uncharacterised nucleotidyltransferase
MSDTFDHGRLIAKVLTHSWRESPSPLEISIEELDIVAPMLLESGAGALGWKRVSNSNHRTTPAALELEQAYRLHALQSAIHERDIKSALTLLRSAGVEPILVKGWAVARLYPESGLRPYGDFDLCVDPRQYRVAKDALDKEASNMSQVDLHQGFKTLDNNSWDELFSRSHLLKIDETEVRVLDPEDHLRVLCFHFLREGAWRPLWLCDIAVALETRPADFDWNLFSGRDERRRKWFACAIVVAHQLLGANVEGVPESLRETTPPGWFLPTLLKAWETRSMLRRHRTPMNTAWRAPGQALRLGALQSHWPNPIEATIGVNGPFNELPRLPFQLGNCAVRTIEFLRHVRDHAAR